MERTFAWGQEATQDKPFTAEFQTGSQLSHLNIQNFYKYNHQRFLFINERQTKHNENLISIWSDSLPLSFHGTWQVGCSRFLWGQDSVEAMGLLLPLTSEELGRTCCTSITACNMYMCCSGWFGCAGRFTMKAGDEWLCWMLLTVSLLLTIAESSRLCCCVLCCLSPVCSRTESKPEGEKRKCPAVMTVILRIYFLSQTSSVQKQLNTPCDCKPISALEGLHINFCGCVSTIHKSPKSSRV